LPTAQRNRAPAQRPGSRERLFWSRSHRNASGSFLQAANLSTG